MAPRPVLPVVTTMQPTLGSKPFHHEGWVYEEKYDGSRMIAYKQGRRVQLVSHRGRDHTKQFRELVAAIRALRARTLILDGEVAIFDEQLVSRFAWLRKHPKGVATLPIYMVFDCLYVNGRDLRGLEFRRRRVRLEVILAGQAMLFPARRLAENGLEAWAEVERRGYEGMVAKDPASSYRGGRTLAWLKVKQPHYREGERGWEPNRKS